MRFEGFQFTFKYCIVQNLHFDLPFPSMPSKCSNAVDNRQMFHPCFGLISTENTTFESIVVGRIGCLLSLIMNEHASR